MSRRSNRIILFLKVGIIRGIWWRYTMRIWNKKIEDKKSISDSLTFTGIRNWWKRPSLVCLTSCCNISLKFSSVTIFKTFSILITFEPKELRRILQKICNTHFSVYLYSYSKYNFWASKSKRSTSALSLLIASRSSWVQLIPIRHEKIKITNFQQILI